MKYQTIIYCVCLLIFTSCKKDALENRTTTCSNDIESNYPDDRGDGTLCTTSLCQDYQSIWQELLQEKNNFDQAFFDEHITLHSSKVNDWSRGSSFRVCYYVNVGWASAYTCDKFIFNISPDDATYPALNLPRDINLTKAEIKLVVDNNAFSSSINEINNAPALLHTTIEDALQELIDFSGVNTLCFSQLKLHRDSGNLILEAWATYENEENSCIRGRIDLFTGEKSVTDMPCYI